MIHDSGERQVFNTGAQRDTAADKPQPAYISPFFLERLGEHLRKGAQKYSPYNWAKGIPNSRCWESLMRHVVQYAQGCRDEDHLAAIAFNCMVIMHNEEVARRGFSVKAPVSDLVDMPKWSND